MEHKIIGKAHIEGTQRGFVVWVKTNKRDKAQLTDAYEDFEAVTATANIYTIGLTLLFFYLRQKYIFTLSLVCIPSTKLHSLH